MTAPAASLKSPGDILEWSSGAGALQKAKRGRVLAVLPAGESLKDCIEKAIGRSAWRIKAQDVAKSARYVVAVQESGRTYYYAPLVKTVDRELRELAALKVRFAAAVGFR